MTAQEPWNIQGIIQSRFLKHRFFKQIWAKNVDSGGFTMKMITKAKGINEISQEEVESRIRTKSKTWAKEQDKKQTIAKAFREVRKGQG